MTRAPEQTSFKWPDSRRGPWRVKLSWGEIEGRVECVGFAVEAIGHKRGVTTTVLRSIPLASLIEMKRAARKKYALDLNVIEGRPLDRDELLRMAEDSISKTQRLLKQKQGGRPREIGPELLAEVARVYDHAYRLGDPPTRAVAEHFGIARSTAGKWVMRARARQMGLLAPTKKRQARGIAQKRGKQ